MSARQGIGIPQPTVRLRPDLAAFFIPGDRPRRPVLRPRYAGVLAELAERGSL